MTAPSCHQWRPVVRGPTVTAPSRRSGWRPITQRGARPSVRSCEGAGASPEPESSRAGFCCTGHLGDRNRDIPSIVMTPGGPAAPQSSGRRRAAGRNRAVATRPACRPGRPHGSVRRSPPAPAGSPRA
ncbi:hypothetical protein ACFFX0_01985 [Citricoccus parietis]|uniref:Uncharacterized protein n=1 Tax=Citricoccus parietis TaxID=592307 RepID=A0ABV5FTL7_9MICC